MERFSIGDIVFHNGALYRIVRVVEFFETADGYFLDHASVTEFVESRAFFVSRAEIHQQNETIILAPN